VENEVKRLNVHKGKEVLDEVTEMWRDIRRVVGFMKTWYPEDVPVLRQTIPDIV
jgi:hypothetical protein